LAPRPTLFTTDPQDSYAVYLLFISANPITLPICGACVKCAKRTLRVPRDISRPADRGDPPAR
jgi:hypothetical protein